MAKKLRSLSTSGKAVESDSANLGDIHFKIDNLCFFKHQMHLPHTLLRRPLRAATMAAVLGC
jgi:hypothetical protein